MLLSVNNASGVFPDCTESVPFTAATLSGGGLYKEIDNPF
jgi:hypothetical protein